jgi:histone-lysine N-methyltransferase SETD3
LDNLSALEALKKAIELEPTNEEFKKLFEETKTEYEEDNTIAVDHPERQRFEKLLKWLKDGGSIYDKLKIRYYTADYRGVHAARDIKKGETILYIPKEQIITLEMAFASPVGKKMFDKNLRQRLISPKHSFLCTYIMQERRKPESEWNIYIDILPQSYSNFPIFFTDEEKELLKGSPFLEQVEEKIVDIKNDYDLICKEVPEFSQFPLREYSEIRMMVSSRIFGIQIEGVKTDGFVAYADMLNHKRPRQTTWNYTDDRRGFVIDALDDIKRGEQVYDSYGKKCNSRFFLNYGFINLDNDADEYPFKIFYNPEDKMKQIKQDMIKTQAEFMKFRVVDNLNERIMHELLSWLRFVEYDDNITLLMQYQAAAQQAAQKYRRGEDSDSDDDDPARGFKAKDLPPLSIKNEKRCLLKLQAMCAEGLLAYPTTMEEDKEILDNRKDLTFNHRNCLLYRYGEKKILSKLLLYCDKILPLLDMDFKTARKIVEKSRELDDCSEYITNSIYHLIKKENIK